MTFRTRTPLVTAALALALIATVVALPAARASAADPKPYEILCRSDYVCLFDEVDYEIRCDTFREPGYQDLNWTCRDYVSSWSNYASRTMCLGDWADGQKVTLSRLRTGGSENLPGWANDRADFVEPC